MNSSMKFDIEKGISFLLVGVGGQGTILASDILAEVALSLGYDVKKAEIHGMSQRGGSVVSNLRWGRQVFSPIVPKGSADILVAFEKLESARFSEFLKQDGFAVINDFAIPPVTVNSGSIQYPSNTEIETIVARRTANILWVDGVGIAEQLGNVKMANVVIIGALCKLLALPPEIVLKAISSRVPEKYLELNKLAFHAGIQAEIASV